MATITRLCGADPRLVRRPSDGRGGAPPTKKQKRNESVTEIGEIPNRGHSLTIDSGWREVCNTALDFVKRFV